MGGKDRMTYSDLNKLFKKHRSLANDLADRLNKTLTPNESQDSQMTRIFLSITKDTLGLMAECSCQLSANASLAGGQKTHIVSFEK